MCALAKECRIISGWEEEETTRLDSSHGKIWVVRALWATRRDDLYFDTCNEYPKTLEEDMVIHYGWILPLN